MADRGDAEAAESGGLEGRLRQDTIAELTRVRGRVTVETLAEKFGVTPQTIRRDLNELAARRRVLRVHGGAIRPSGTANLEYDNRRLLAAEAKAAIALEAAKVIPDEASLFVNIGTTTEAVSEALLSHRSLMVITNNINVADRMRAFPNIEVVIAGGVVRGSDGGIVGAAAVDFIEQFRVDYAVIGASAIDDDGTLLDFDFREVKVAQAIIRNARQVVLVADSSKFGRPAPIRIGHLSQIHAFVTERCNESLRSVCADHGVRLIEAAPIDAG